jgi:hypothetical protein
MLCLILQAYVFTKAAKIVGVEINADFCNIQNKIINKYNFQVCIGYDGQVSKTFHETLVHKLAAAFSFVRLFILGKHNTVTLSQIGTDVWCMSVVSSGTGIQFSNVS